MATFIEIKEVRIKLNDPPGFIDFIQVADMANLPATPAQQTAYNVIANGWYVATTKTTGATQSDYTQKQLYIADEMIGAYIDNFRVDKAIPYLIKVIISKLAANRLLVRSQTGTESKEYTSLSDLLKFYNDLLKKYQDDANTANNDDTGKYLRTRNPTIAGGNI